MSKNGLSHVEKQIMRFLEKNKGISFKQRTIAKNLGLHQAEYEIFKKTIRVMSRTGKIERGRKNRYRLPNKSRNVVGIISFSSKGFAFVTTKDNEEIFIPAYESYTAFNHDEVLVEKYRKQRGKSPEGKVIKVIKRSKEPIIAAIKKLNGKWIAILDSPAPPTHIEIIGENRSLRQGQLAELVNLEWDNPRYLPRCEIKQILGIPTEARDDVIILKRMFKLPESFPKRVIEEAKRISPPDISKELKHRIDFRDKEVFTIDPVNARDYDDAVSLEKHDGNWLLGVHIADVSSFIKDGSFIDREARKRGNSIYFYEEVIPMLPEKLSNQVASLQPDTDRLTMSVMIEIDKNGNIIKYEIAPSIIHSKKRFTYEEVQEILDNGEGPHWETLSNMRILSKMLYDKRSQMGSIDFDMPEPVFEMDENFVPYELKPSKRLDSHRLIEEFMLLANRMIAEWIAIFRREENLPFIYRVHKPPLEESIERLYTILSRLGVNIKRSKKFTPLDLREILETVKEMPFKNFVEQIALRSMTKAYYSYQPFAHYGLAFRNYTHFTSPVRRYPDLEVHRLVKIYLGSYTKDDIVYYRHALPKIAKKCSDTEIRAMEVEREYVKIKQIRFISTKIGQLFAGIITGVMEFGFFVELSDYLVEGLVHVRTLNDDYYEFEEIEHTLKGRKYNRTFRLGDVVKVKVVSVSVIDRRVDLELEE
jgi:ribonuclease R